jgi:lipid II:glycine glycyltransferase (peptidoglycan interpeptide bridge formation enzyme)
MESLGWKVVHIYNKKNKTNNSVFIRTIPILGSFIKILRIKPPIPYAKISELAQKFRAFKIQIEADSVVLADTPDKNGYTYWGYKKTENPLIPTKTILIDLSKNQEKIFQSFSPEKRRAIRRAGKNKLEVKESADIEEFIFLKNSQLWPFGFLLSGEIKKLWKAFFFNGKAKLIIAKNKGEKIPQAGVLLLFHKNTSYYWLASATKSGKHLFAPALAVWEAVKLSKKMGYKFFDFEGIEDERFRNTRSWEGFSRFKLGFGGKIFIYTEPIQKSCLAGL